MLERREREPDVEKNGMGNASCRGCRERSPNIWRRNKLNEFAPRPLFSGTLNR